jgi:hypothetical protein
MFVASKKVMIINRLKNCQNIDSVVIMEFNISENDTKKPNTYSIDFNNTGHKDRLNRYRGINKRTAFVT